MNLRAATILATFALFTVPLMPVQALLLRVSPNSARRFPHWYHRKVCFLLGIDLEIDGQVSSDAPVLLIANHSSWLDIPVISAVAPVSFVAKKEVASWPFVATLARLQRTVFVDRERRTKVGQSASEIMTKLAAGDTVVLFAEGTSSDGNRILPFKTSLFAAAMPTARTGAQNARTVVQTLTLVYTRRNGIPLDWTGRREMGYVGNVSFGDNAFGILSGGPIAATIRISEPVPLDTFKDRKALAQWAESDVRSSFVKTLRGEGSASDSPSMQ